MSGGSVDGKRQPPTPYTIEDFKADFGRLLSCVDALADQRDQILNAVRGVPDLQSLPAAADLLPDSEPPSRAQEQPPDSQPADSQLSDSEVEPACKKPTTKMGGIMTLF